MQLARDVRSLHDARWAFPTLEVCMTVLPSIGGQRERRVEHQAALARRIAGAS
jgi:hypothetical protein